MAIQDWVRHEGPLNTSPNPQRFDHLNDEQFILLVRDIQYDDISKGNYTKFNSLYDVAMSNSGSYIPITNNYKLKQEPPNPSKYR
jgi:hypothetical protein